MKKMKRILLVAMAALSMACVATACGVIGVGSSSSVAEESGSRADEKIPSEGLAYRLMSEVGELDDGEEDYYVMTGMGTCTDTCVVIPSEHNGLPVKTIALFDDYYVEVLRDFENMSEDEIEEYLNEMEEEGIVITSVAIEKLVIPDSVSAIAAIYLGNLKELYIGKGLSEADAIIIKNLQTLVVEEENENFSGIGGNLYSKDGKNLVRYFGGEIAEGTETTSAGALAGSSMEMIAIPDSMTSITADCEFDEHGYSVGPFLFVGCRNLTSIEVSENNSKYKSIDGNVYSKDGKTLLLAAPGKTRVVIPDGVTNIGDCAFAGCRGLTSVEIGDSVTSIGNFSFYYCTGLTSVTIGDSVTSIGGWAFDWCTSLTSVEIGEGVTSIA